MITFICKNGVDYSKYGLVEESTEWVKWNSIKKLIIKKKNMQLSFNMPSLDDLKTFYEMIKDDVVFWKDIPRNKGRYHYIGLTEEEYELIQNRRNEL